MSNWNGFYLPPPKPKSPPQRERQVERSEVREEVRFQDRAPDDGSWERTKAILRERLYRERDVVRAEIENERSTETPAIAERSSTPPRRVTAEETLSDGAVKRWFSDGSVLTRHAGGLVTGQLADGSEYRSQDGADSVRVNSGPDACTLHA